MFGCQPILLKPDKKLKAVLEYICQESNKLHNCAVYYARQIYFKAHICARPFDIINELKRNHHYGALCAQAAQQTCGAVGESVKSFRGLAKLFQEGKLENKPKFPGYRTPGGLHLIAYPKQALGKKLIDGQISIPLGLKVKAWFGLKNFQIPMPSNLDYADIREIRILPRNGCFYAEFVYRSVPVQTVVDPEKVLGIDHGIDNWLTCLSNSGTSFIVDGKYLKSVNQWYNKRVSVLALLSESMNRRNNLCNALNVNQPISVKTARRKENKITFVCNAVVNSSMSMNRSEAIARASSVTA